MSNTNNELWYEKLGFKSNPFSIKPAALNDSVIGYDSKLARLNLSIRIGAAWFITGAFGSGKTTLLKHIINNHKKTKKVIYCSMNRKEQRVDFRKLLLGRGNFFMRLFGIIPKNTILLIDEAQYIDRKECEQILYYYEQQNIKSIIFVAERFENVSLAPKLRQLIGENIISLNSISKDVGIEIVRSRIGSLDFFPDNMIKKIVQISDHNPRKLLENCEDVCRYAVQQEAKKVTLQHLKAIE